MDFAKLSERIRRQNEIEARLGKAIWTYRCLRNCGCKDQEYLTNLPKHLMKCGCEYGWHDHDAEFAAHRSPCGAYTEIVARSPAAVEVDVLREEHAPVPPEGSCGGK